jgi:hypothetical protein
MELVEPRSVIDRRLPLLRRVDRADVAIPDIGQCVVLD